MNLGVDFDNTLVCYDGLFYRAAAEQRLLEVDDNQQPPHLQDKTAVRDHLRRAGREDDWTKLQGYVYGAAIDRAPPYTGALRFFHRCRAEQVPVTIISHRTKTPYLGPSYDLHQAGDRWLTHHQFLANERTGLTKKHVHWEETREAKFARIAAVGCTHFIDDLPEFLSDAQFPGDVQRILFEPNRRFAHSPDFYSASSWPEIERMLFGERRQPDP